MSFWTVKCPVCGEELPERGNRRVYVPWKRGFKLVHADDCAGLIAAQGVLDFAQRKPPALSPVLLVKARRCVERFLELHEPAEYTTEELVAIRRLVVASDGQESVREVHLQHLDYSVKRLRELRDRVFVHAGSIRPGSDGFLV